MIENSITSSWKDVYPLKQNTYTRVEQPLNYNNQTQRDPNYKPNPELVKKLKTKYEPKKTAMDRFNEVLDRFVARGDDEE